VSQGRLVWTQGQMRVDPGTGRYLKRPAFGPHFKAAHRRTLDLAPQAVVR